MKSIQTLAIALSLTLLGAPSVVAQTGHDLFQQALVKERSDGDLRGAIAIYERIAEEFTSDRALTAKALVQMGQCYEKLGSTEAERAYRRVVREFADQDDLVARAQSRLAAMQRAARAAEPVGITTQQVWSGLNAGAHDPTPDGKFLVWNDFQGTMNLAVREIATGKSRYLTDDSRYLPTWAVAYDGRVSRDGRWVAHGYSEEGQGGSLRIVGVDGENVRELLREEGCWIQPHQWTSDGAHIAARWDCWSESNPEGTHKIVLVRVGDGAMRVLHEVPGAAYGIRSWLSPDDRYLVYHGPVKLDDGNRDIWLLPLDGSGEANLIQHPADDRLLGWVPGTDYIVFLSDRDGTWDLWAARVGDGRVVEAPRKVQRDIGMVEPAGFSDDGSLFYSVFTRWFNTSIAPFDVTTGDADFEAATPVLGSHRSPHWSPDGERLAFVTESFPMEGKRGRITIQNVATGERRSLAEHLSVRFVGDWSPDGRSILASAWDEREEDPGYAGALYSVDVETGRAEQILGFREAYGAQDIWAEWLPGGDAIIYSVRGDNSAPGRLVHRDLGSGEERELYRDLVLEWLPLQISPDGRRLVFAVDPSPDAVTGVHLWVIDLESGSTRRLVTSGASASGKRESVQWTPDSEWVLFTQQMGEDNDTRTEVFRVALSGGEPEHLWTVGEGKYGSWIALSPDGKQIALTTYTQENEIWVMENLKAVLER